MTLHASRPAFILAALLVMLGSVAAQSKKPAAAGAKKNVEEEIKNLEMKLAQLIMSGDADAYGRYLDDDYILINAAGVVVTKPQILAAMKSGVSSDSLLPSDLHVRVYGETAILNGRQTWKGTVNGTHVERDWLSTKVFIRRNGQWRMVNSQGTPLPPPVK